MSKSIPDNELAIDTSDGKLNSTTFSWSNNTLWLKAQFRDTDYDCGPCPGDYQSVYDRCVEINKGSHRFVILNEDDLT